MVPGSVIKNRETLFILDFLSKGFAEEKGDLLDWDALFKKTLDWGIAPYFYSRIQDGKNGPISDSLIERFKGVYLFSSARNLLLINTFKELIELFRAEGIGFVPVKGIVFLIFYYDDAGSRFTTDIDIIINKEQINDALSILKSRGYLECGNPNAWHKSPLKNHDNLEVELHFDFRHSGKNKSYIEKIFAHSRDVKYNGILIRTPSVYDLLIIQAFSSILSGAYGQGSIIKCCIDFINAIEKTPDWSWEYFYYISEESKTEGAVYLVLKFLNELLIWSRAAEGEDIFRRRLKSVKNVDSVFRCMIKDGDIILNSLLFSLYGLITQRGLRRFRNLRYALRNRNSGVNSFRSRLSINYLLQTLRIARILNYSR